MINSMPSISLKIQTCKQNVLSVLTCSLKNVNSLDKDLKNFWKLESYDDNKTRGLSADNKYCEL